VGVIAGFSRFLISLVGGPVILLRVAPDSEKLEAFGSIIAWFTAFAGADCFGMLLLQTPWSASLGYSFAGVVVAGGILWILTYLASWARHLVVERAGAQPREVKELWSEHCARDEANYTGFIAGFVISVWVRFCISGSLSMPYSHPVGHTREQTYILCLVSVAVLCTSVVVIVAVHTWTLQGSSSRAQRFATMTQQMMSMTSSWLILFSGEWWCFWMLSDTATLRDETADLYAAMSLAMFSFVFAFLAIFVIDFAAGRTGPRGEALLSLNTAFVMIISISWQQLYFVAITSVGSHHGSKQHVANAFLLLAVCAIVAPAWYLYIMPGAILKESLEQQKEGVKEAESHEASVPEQKEAPLTELER